MALALSWERFVPERIRRAGWMRPRYPLVSVELREDAIIATKLKYRRGYHLAGYGRRDLPEGMFTTSMVQTKIADPQRFAREIGAALKAAGVDSPTKISLAVPDTVARVFLLDFQEMPRTNAQAEEVIRWRLKKSVPFALEDARMTWERIGTAPDGREQLLVAVAPGDGLSVVENLLVSQGYRVGLVDLASFDLFNALRVEGTLNGRTGKLAEDIALLSATPTYFSLMIMRGPQVIFYRAKNYHVHGTYQGEQSVRVVGRELRTSLSYYEEHLLGDGIGKIYARIVGIDPQAIIDTLHQSNCGDVLPARIEKCVPEMAGFPEELAFDLMPCIGLATRREP